MKKICKIESKLVYYYYGLFSRISLFNKMCMHNYVVYDTPEYRAACEKNNGVRCASIGADEDYMFRTPIDSFDQLLNERYDSIVKMNFSQQLTYIPANEDGGECLYDIIETRNGWHLVIENQPDLSKLVRLPARLEQFHCTNCLIEKLPPIPKTLVKLNVSGNPIGELPHLEDSNLCFLYCSECFLHTLPALPNTLIRLNCSFNHIKVIPEPLPQLLREVAIYNNLIEYLPNPTHMTCTMEYQHNPIQENPIRQGYIDGTINRRRRENSEYYKKYGILAFDEFSYYHNILQEIT